MTLLVMLTGAPSYRPPDLMELRRSVLSEVEDTSILAASPPLSLNWLPASRLLLPRRAGAQRLCAMARSRRRRETLRGSMFGRHFLRTITRGFVHWRLSDDDPGASRTISRGPSWHRLCARLSSRRQAAADRRAHRIPCRSRPRDISASISGGERCPTRRSGAR